MDNLQFQTRSVRNKSQQGSRRRPDKSHGCLGVFEKYQREDKQADRFYLADLTAKCMSYSRPRTDKPQLRAFTI